MEREGEGRDSRRRRSEEGERDEEEKGKCCCRNSSIPSCKQTLTRWLWLDFLPGHRTREARASGARSASAQAKRLPGGPDTSDAWP